MKNKLFLIAITLCVGLQPNISFASEKQNWTDWFRSKWSQLTGSRKVKITKERGQYALPATIIGSTIASQTLTTPISEFASAATKAFLNTRNTQIIITTGILFGLLTADIYSIITYYQTGYWSKTDAIIQIQNALRLIINDPLLYPTRSSKLHALFKKDEFLQYITDEYGLVQEACNELIGKIDAIPYSNEQKEIDRTIDEKMTEIKKTIIQYETLDDQIKALENQKQALDISGMQAYLSVYFRLKNKQAVEQKLSPEEKVSRQKWSAEARAVRVSEPSVD